MSAPAPLPPPPRRQGQGALVVALVTSLAVLVAACGWYAVRRTTVPLLVSERLGADRSTDALLAEGTVPGEGGPWAEATRRALEDLDALTDPATGAVLAGPRSSWRYVWPRDAAFVAVAFACTGRSARAEAVLGFLQRVQAPDGLFQARYRPDGSVPDARGVQVDGTGWALWAVRGAVRCAPAGERAGLLARLGPLVERSSSALVRLVDTPTGLPPASPDWWELPVRSTTLGTVAPVLAGLDAAAGLLPPGSARDDVVASAARLRSAAAARYGLFGWPRHPGGRARDASVAMLLPPFLPAAPRGAVPAWRAAQRELRSVAGGLVPGAGWPRNGIAWTPTAGLFALTAASTGDTARAAHWLDWLVEHRTASGSLPEKVLADGSPASVAPLAWTCALVVLTVAALDGQTPVGVAR